MVLIQVKENKSYLRNIIKDSDGNQVVLTSPSRKDSKLYEQGSTELVTALETLTSLEIPHHLVEG